MPSARPTLRTTSSTASTSTTRSSARSRLRPGWDRDRILGALEAEGIPGRSGSCSEMYLEKAFADRSFPVLPVAHELGEISLMLPVHPTLAESDVDDMVDALRKVFAHAAG